MNTSKVLQDLSRMTLNADSPGLFLPQIPLSSPKQVLNSPGSALTGHSSGPTGPISSKTLPTFSPVRRRTEIASASTIHIWSSRPRSLSSAESSALPASKTGTQFFAALLAFPVPHPLAPPLHHTPATLVPILRPVVAASRSASAPELLRPRPSSARTTTFMPSTGCPPPPSPFTPRLY